MSVRRARWGGLSLRFRLTLVTAGLLMVGLVLGAVALTTVVSASRISVLDELASKRAATIAALAKEDRLPEPLPAEEAGEIAQVLDGVGLVVASSANASRTLPVLSLNEASRLRGGRPTTLRSAYDERARVVVVPASLRGEPVTVVVSLPPVTIVNANARMDSRPATSASSAAMPAAIRCEMVSSAGARWRCSISAVK